ncbi:MAG: hypothetical protein JXR63_00465 [Spirochaetales bacterium]|nr:hypothetical protein [Spirochaetales bacterium]
MRCFVGEIFKFGESINPKTRYGRKFYNGNNAYMDIISEGSKIDIHNWKYLQILDYYAKNGVLPPLNKSFW